MKRELLYITFATGILAVTSAPLPLCAEEVTGEEAMSAVAGWMNAFPSGHDAVANRIRTLTVRQFSDAYLLNLDLMQNFGYGFNISDISTANENVTVDVTLVRTNALATAGINGTLKLYGGETLGGITNVLDKAEFDDAKFSRGDTAQAEFQQDGTNTFYKAIIE